MSEPEKERKRARELLAEIARHDALYHRLEAPEISDARYDALVRELEELLERHPDLAPTRGVGAAPSEAFAPVRHSAPLLSLDNVFSDAELEAWYGRVERTLGRSPELFVEPKIDGVAVAIVYEKGELVRAATRGDGLVGEDVTANVLALRDVPRRLETEKPPDWLELRGEIYLSEADFTRINAELGEAGRPLFANARNAASGMLRQKDPAQTAPRPLRLCFHGLVRTDAPPPTYAGIRASLASLGLPVHPEGRACPDLEAARSAVQSLLGRRHALGHGVDGAVLKVDALEAQAELGATSRAPRWAVAYKFPAEEQTTRVNDIFVSIGRTGAATPFASLEPVRVGGVTISLATLHNELEVARKDVRVGDTVVVRRAGDVMPEVVAPVLSQRPASAKPFEMPSRCPVCGGPIVRPEGEAVARCENFACPAQARGRIAHFASRSAMDIAGLGDAVASALVERNLVQSPADLFFLRAEDLEALPGFGRRSAEKLLAGIEKAKSRPVPRLLVGLGIRHVGPSAAKRLVEAFGSLDAIAEANAEALASVEGVGRVIGEAVRAFFDAAENRKALEKLRRAGVRLEEPRAASFGHLAGKRFVLTGTLAFLSREEAAARIEAAGGKVGSDVSKRTDYLVVGASPGSKLERARRLGVPTLDEAELLALLG